MPDISPYRLPCSGTSSIQIVNVVGGLFQNYRPSSSFDAYHNNTDPPPMPIPGGFARGPCFSCDSTVGTIYPSGLPLGANWSSAFFGTTGEQWQGTSSVDLQSIQTFTSSNYKENLGVCHQYGFKGYAGAKQWHGQYGFLSNDRRATPDRAIAVDGTRYRTIERNVSGSWSLTLYSSTAYASGITPLPSGYYLYVYTKTFSLISKLTVNRYSGVVEKATFSLSCDVTLTQNGTDITYLTKPELNYGPLGEGSGIVAATVFNLDFGSVISGVYDPIGVGINFIDQGTKVLVDYNGTLSGFQLVSGWSNGTAADLVEHLFASENYGSHGTVTPNHSITTGTNSATGTDTSSVDVTGFATAYFDGTATASFSNTEIHVTTSTSFQEPDFGDGNAGEGRKIAGSLTIDVVLSDPYTSDDVASDINTNLLPLWKLNGPEPWRHDPWTGIMPLVQYKEVQSNVQPDLIVSGNGGFSLIVAPTWVDPNETAGYSDDIIGGPHPNGPGGSGWFDFYFSDTRFCFCDITYDFCPSCGVNWFQYQNTYGGTLADANISVSSHIYSGVYSDLLPINSTHWTNNAMTHSIPRGAIIDIGGISGIPNGVVFITKKAFAKLPVPSYNFARPCNYDRVLIDEDSAQCFANDLTTYGPLPDLTGKTILVYGNAYSGIYTGSTQTAYDLALGTKIADIPTGYYHPFCGLENGGTNHFNNGFVGIVRFPNAPALCGRQQFTFTDNHDGDITVTFSSIQPNLRYGDYLDFWDKNMTAITSSCKVTSRIDDYNFWVQADFSSMTGAIYATSTGASPYYWNDNTAKGDYRYGEWDNQNRTSTSSFSGCTASCASNSPCCPSVMAFTPNNDYDSSWQHEWFNTFVADGIYGSRRQLNVEFEIPDLLYQSPLTPMNYTTDGGANYNFTAFEDTGFCQQDVSVPNLSGGDDWTIWYPPHPQVEARCDSPSGSPAFTTDSLGHTIDWSPMTQPSNPGVINFSFTLPVEDFTLYANEIYTIHSGSNCRFLPWYYAKSLGGGM